jgi:hypothetical protein
MQAPYMLRLDARGTPGDREQKAVHAIPAGMKMGKELPLIRPDRPAAQGTANNVPQEQQNWTLKIYWGSSKTVQKGQPLVISPQDMKSGKGKFAELAGGAGVWKGEPPSGWGWGEWPNKQSSIPVPAGASLRGGHQVTGGYLPDIQFSMDRHDFLPPLSVKTGGDVNSSISLSWSPVKGAAGYFVSAVAANQAKKETIIWTSSSRASMGMQTHEHSSRINELVSSGVVMGPDKSAADVPAGIFAGCEGVMLMASAWGEDYWASYPPRPANAPKNWKPDWTVNALFLSTWTGMPGVDVEAMSRGMGGGDYQKYQQKYQEEADEQDKQGEEKQQKQKQQKKPGLRLPVPGFKF